jgi:hypothetical protein
MIYEISLKIKVINELTELSYYEVWRMQLKTFMPYEQPILNIVFKREQTKLIPPHPSDLYLVLVEAQNSSSKEATKVFVTGRNLIREFLTIQYPQVKLVYQTLE